MDFCGTLTCDLQLSMPIDALPSEPRSPYGMAGMATSLSLRAPVSTQMLLTLMGCGWLYVTRCGTVQN